MKLLEPQFLIIVLLIVLVMYGPKRLPELGRTIGKTIRSVREGLEGPSPGASPTDVEVASHVSGGGPTSPAGDEARTGH